MRIGFHNRPYTDPFEYWCYNCGTMNLSLCETDNCLGCGKGPILKGAVGSLDKETLVKEYAKTTLP